MNKIPLDSEEETLLMGLEAGEWKSDLSPQRRTFLAHLAEAKAKKDKRINIRIASQDLDALQRRALAEGISYQTLVASILHKYVSGSLIDARKLT